MLPNVTMRDITKGDVERIVNWLMDDEIAEKWFGRAGPDPVHRGYDPLLMVYASESEWVKVFVQDPALIVLSIYDEENDHIGECQLLARDDIAELSILIGRKDRWRQGYGTAAVVAVLDQAFNFYMVKRVTVSVPKDNIPALGLFDKLGFTRNAESGDNVEMYRRRSRLEEVDIFGDLSYEQIERVASLGKEIDVSAGHMLGSAGDPGLQLFVIMEGQAELSAPSNIGEITVRIAGPGESFPIASLIGSRRLITSATAMTDMKLLEIPSDKLLAMCAEDTQIGMSVYATIADILGTRYSRTLSNLTASTEKVLKDAEFFANV